MKCITILFKKVYAYDNDRTNCNDTCTANVIRELCHDRDTYHYPVNKDSCSVALTCVLCFEQLLMKYFLR